MDRWAGLNPRVDLVNLLCHWTRHLALIATVNHWIRACVFDLSTNLSEAACANADLANPPQWHQEDGGEGHGPAQCIGPVWVHVPAVKLERLIVHHV